MFNRLSSVAAISILGTAALIAGFAAVFGSASDRQTNAAPTINTGVRLNAILGAGQGGRNPHFGRAVAASADGSTVVIAQPWDRRSGSNRGAIFVYTRPAGGWVAGSPPTPIKLIASDSASNDQLGNAVAVSSNGDTIVAGAQKKDRGGVTETGGAYVYTRPATGWAATASEAVLTVSNSAANDVVGWAVAISGDGSTVVLGGPGKDISGVTGGSHGEAYVYLKPSSGWGHYQYAVPDATVVREG